MKKIFRWICNEIRELLKKKKTYVNKQWSNEWVESENLTTYLSRMENNRWNLYRIGEVRDGTCDVIFYKYEITEEWE